MFVAGCGGVSASEPTPRASATGTARTSTVASRPTAAQPPSRPRPHHPAAPAPRAPALLDRGAAPVAIARSLLLWGRWLEAEHPDPALVDRAYAWGGSLERGVLAEVTVLRRTGRRIVEVDVVPLEFVVVSQLPDVVSFRVTEHLDHRELVDANGRVLDRVGPATEHYIVLLQRFAVHDPWRLAAVDGVQLRVEVRL
jgi:hypothetical protein